MELESSISKGGVKDLDKISIFSATNSIEPVPKSSFSAPSILRVTSPSTEITHSDLRLFAFLYVSSEIVGLKTTCVIPDLSLKSIKINCP